MRHLVGIVIAGVAFAVGAGAVRGVEFAIGEAWPVADSTVTAVSPDLYGTVDDSVDEVLTDPVTIKVNGIGIRATEADVLRRFGKPNRITGLYSDDPPDNRYKAYEYDDLTITLDSYQNGKWTVGGISVYSPKWDINGFRIGSALSDVYQKLGRSYQQEDDAVDYTDTSGWRVWIHVVDGHVDIIDVGYHGC